MKKILAAVDAMHFTEAELRNYKYIAEKARGTLTILFLENIYAESLLYANANAESGYFDYEEIFREKIEQREKKIKANKQKLLNFYQDSDTVVTLREIDGVPVMETLAETRFADLLVIKNTTSFALLREDTKPPRFVKDLLAGAQCPVMVIPEAMPYFRNIVFTYNGSYSSAYAIRQFTLVFDDLSETPVKVLYVIEGNNKKIPSGKMIKEYLGHHYEEVIFKSLEGNPAEKITSFAKETIDCVVTFGAYGRSSVSKFFHKSDATDLLRNAITAIFITHP